VTVNDGGVAPLMSESEMENKVASKLVHMLVSKGISKIIKKYGYLPVDYLKKEKTDNALEIMGVDQAASNKKSTHKRPSSKQH